MDEFGGSGRQQSSRPLPSITPWGTTRPYEYPTYMGSFGPQPWEPIYPSDSSAGLRLQQVHALGNNFQHGFDNPQVSSSRLLLQQPLPGSAYQFPLQVNDDPMSDSQAQSLKTGQQDAAIPQKNKRHIYSQSEWDQQLPRIKEMYMDNDLTLRETKARMAAEYDFHPS